MKRLKSKLLKILFAVVGIIFLILLIPFGSLIYGFFSMGNNMGVGKLYMENLNDEELLSCILDARRLHEIDSLKYMDRKEKYNYNKNLDKKYTKKGIIKIDVSEKAVSYGWMGGFEHTYLGIGFEGDSVVCVMACYSDYARQLLYPEVKEVSYDFDSPKNYKIKGNRKLTGKLTISNNKR